VPRQPGSHETAVLPDHDLENEGTYRGLAYTDIDLSGRSAESVELLRCRFVGSDLSGVTLDRAAFADCVMDTGSLANLHARRSSLTRTRVSLARMTGFTWVDGVLRDVAFEGCRLDLSGWRFSKLAAVTFTDCNLTGADFTGADLSGARFTGCDLTRAQFSGARMAGAHLRDCVLVDVGGVTSWTGATIGERDLMALSYSLAAALGIRLSDD
jgi:uncharacterized protein YjbI with pentapeptide repeats